MLFDKHIDFILSRKDSGKRMCFGFIDEIELRTYLRWSAYFGYLFEIWNSNKLTGLGIAYPIDSTFPNDDDITKFSSPVPYDQENSKSLYIADWIANDSETRKKLVSQFKLRYPNWENQSKFGSHNGTIKLLSNKYINLLNNI